MGSTSAPLVIAAVLGAACDAQVESDYPGTALVELHGAVAATGEVEIETMLIRWSTDDPQGPGEASSPLALKTAYPAQFTAALLDIPPSTARLAFAGEPAFSEGYLFALDGSGGTVGTDFDHVLVWLDGPVSAGGHTAAYLGGAAEAGFTICARQNTQAPSSEQEILAERCRARALGEGWDRDRAETACGIARAYLLLPTPQGIATRWKMQAVAGGP